MGSSPRRRVRLRRWLFLPWVIVALGCAATVPQGRADASAPSDARTWETVGTSREGHPIRAITLDASESLSESLSGTPHQPREAASSAWPPMALIAGIHGNEREGGRHLPELLDLLRTYRGAVRVYEDVNPDGTQRGARFTSKGVDPNRNWPARNFRPSRQRGPAPLSEPGVAAVYADLIRFDPELVLVLHSTTRGPFVNFDGPAEAYARMFASAAGTPWTVEPSMGYPTPGSFGSWMGIDNGVPTLTIEFQRGCDEAESGRALMAGVAAILRGKSVPESAAESQFVVH